MCVLICASKHSYLLTYLTCICCVDIAALCEVSITGDVNCRMELSMCSIEVRKRQDS